MFTKEEIKELAKDLAKSDWIKEGNYTIGGEFQMGVWEGFNDLRTPEWYDNCFEVFTYVDENDEARIEVTNSETRCFEKVYIEDTEDTEEIEKALIELKKRVQNYLDNLPEDIVEKGKELGSCFDKEYMSWIA